MLGEISRRKTNAVWFSYIWTLSTEQMSKWNKANQRVGWRGMGKKAKGIRSCNLWHKVAGRTVQRWGYSDSIAGTSYGDGDGRS